MRKALLFFVIAAIGMVLFIPEVREGLAPVYRRTIGSWFSPSAPRGAREYDKVYVVREGRYYHRKDCPALENQAFFVTSLDKAKRLWEPCPVCKPGR